MARRRRGWLVKSEPDVYGIDDLERDGSTGWDGVRNYTARNHMRDMRVGDRVLFYHSNASPPGVAGLAEVVREAHPDPTQFDRRDPHFDPKSPEDDPRWWMVDVEFVERFPRFVPLDALRAEAALDGMLILRRGNRLSVTPVEAAHFRQVLRMGGARSR